MIAHQFQITIPKQFLNYRVKAELINHLRESGILSLPVADRRVVPMDEKQNVVETDRGRCVSRNKCRG